MKSYRILLIILTILLSGCKKEDISNSGNEISIETLDSYIIFDAGISTRGGLIKRDYLDANFYVLGYQYPGSWETEYQTLLPEVFEDAPQEVKFDSGQYSYTPYKKWTGNTYSFFSYYPVGYNSNIKLFDDNNTTKRGVPYITYTLPSSNDPRQMIDLMTGCVMNTGVNFNTANTVSFQMKHRLAAVDVRAYNYYKVDHDGDSSTPAQGATIEITDMTITFNNLTTEAKIYLDESTPLIPTKSGINTYQIVGSTDWGKQVVQLSPNNDSTPGIQKITTEDSGKESIFLFIPQTDYLTGTIQLDYKIKYGNTVYSTLSDVIKDFIFETSLIGGNRYYLGLTFTSDAISVSVNSTNAWDELEDDVEHKFE